MTGITINLLGGFEAVLDKGGSIAFDSDKDRALLIYLIASGNRPIHRGILTGLFWPENTEKAARHSLSQAIYSLRRQFQSRGVTDPFEISQQTVLFPLQDSPCVDVYRFDQLVQEYFPSGVQSNLTNRSSLEHLKLACEIYRGDFCAGLTLKECNSFETWLCFQRELYHLKYMRVLELLTQGLCLVGDPENALIFAYKKVFQDPYDESSQRQVILLLFQLGQRKQAIEHYETYASLLVSELNASPSTEMMTFCHQLLSIPEYKVIPHS